MTLHALSFRWVSSFPSRVYVAQGTLHPLSEATRLTWGRSAVVPADGGRGEVAEVLRGAHGRASNPLGMNTSIRADRVCSPRSIATNPDPETLKTLTSTSSFTCSSTPCPVPNRTRLAFRSQLTSRVQITPARSSAVAGTAL